MRREIFEDVIRRKGNPSGEQGTTNVELMRSTKKSLDPKGILNPGKIFAL